MYKSLRALQSRSNDESRIGKSGSSEKCAGSELATVCDRIVSRSENDDNHDRFELLGINKLLRLRLWSLTDSRRLHQYPSHSQSKSRDVFDRGRVAPGSQPLAESEAQVIWGCFKCLANRQILKPMPI